MKLLLQLSFLFPALVLPAQVVEDFVIGLAKPVGLDIYEGVLYVVQQEAKSISKIDLSNPSPTVEEVLTLTEESIPIMLANDGTYLYYSDFSKGNISRIEMGITNPVPELILDNLDDPSGLLIDGNTLYFGHDLNKVSKIELSEPYPVMVDLTDGAWFATGFAFSENDLFIAEFDLNRISKIDVAETMPGLVDVLTELSTPIQFALNGNDLYYSEYLAGRLSKIDITIPNPTVEVIASNLDRPAGLVIDGTTLYFCQSTTGKISKIEGFITNSYEIQEKPMIAYPNPASDYLMLEHLAKAQSAQIVNGMGQLIETIQLFSGNTWIDMRDLNPGVYFLILDSGSSLKFVKMKD